MKHKLLISILSLMMLSSFAQSTIQLKTIEEDNGKPLPYCHVCIRDLVTNETKYFVTNEEGLADFKFNGNTVVSVSFMGFETIFDTISQSVENIEYVMKEQSFDFDEVVVTGQNKPISVDKSIYNIKLIGKKEIEQTASNSLTDVLSRQANIQINNDASLGSSIKLQGITGENIKILIDNVPVIGRMDGNIDLGQINLSEVDHIEIVEGPMSVIYGSNALGGVINIITKKNKYARIKAGADLYYESVGVYNANGRFNWKKNKNAADISFGRNFFEGYSIVPGSRRQDWKPKEQYNAATQYIYNNERLVLRAKLDGFSEKLLDRNDVFPPYFYATDTWFYTKRLNSSIHGDYQLSDLDSFKTLFSYSYFNREKEKLVKDLSTLNTFPSPEPTDFDTSIFNAVVARGTYNRHTISEVLEYQMGFDLNWEDAKGKRILNKYQMIGDYAAFLILKWKITDKLRFQPSLRASYNTKYKSPLVPSLNLKYSWEKNAIRFSYARGFRAPSLKELYLNFVDTNHEIEGNPDLKAEYGHNFNLTYNGHVLINEEPWSYKLSLFYNDIYNKIQLAALPDLGELAYTNINIGRFHSTGGSFQLNIRPSYNTEFFVNYSLIGENINKIGFYFHSNVAANASFSFMENTAKFNMVYNYFGEYINPVIIGNIVYLPVQDDYHDMDINVTKDFFNKSLVLGFGVKNLFNNIQIQQSGDFSGSAHGGSSVGATSPNVDWGRTLFVSLKYQFTKYN